VTSATPQTRAWRLRVYPLVVLLTLGAALVFSATRYDVDNPASRLGGDYPSFYSAGSIVGAGDWDELYDPVRQQAEQGGLIDDEGGYLYFSYPPFFAAVYGALAGPAYQWSFVIHTVLMTLALVGAIVALSPWLGRTGLPLSLLVVLGLAFQPVLTSVAGGQNTTLSLLLLAGAARLDHEDRPVLAGLVAALLVFKPQFGLVVVPLLVVSRRRRVLAGWGLGVLVLFAVSSLLVGGNWLGDWWSQASAFRELNATANGANFVSLPGFMENLLGTGSGTALVVGYGLAAVVAAAVAWQWWVRPRADALWRWALAGAAAMAVAPQTLFYDTGLLLLVLVAMVPTLSRPVLVVAGVAALSWLQLAKPTLGWSPLGPLALGAVALVLWSQRGSRRPAVPT